MRISLKYTNLKIINYKALEELLVFFVWFKETGYQNGEQGYKVFFTN